jgi:hypothetical protein
VVALVPPPAAPTSISIPAGSSSGNFTLQAAANVTGQVTITATLNQQSIAATVTVLPPPTLTGSLVLSASRILVGGVAQGTFKISAQAPPTPPIVVSITSSNPTVATIQAPTAVTVTVGNDTGTFLVNGVAAGTTTISARLGSVTLTAPLTVTQKTHIDKNIPIEKAVPIEKAIPVENVSPFPLSEPQPGVNPIRPSAISSVESTVGTEQEAPAARAFIRPEERPPVGEDIVRAAGAETAPPPAKKPRKKKKNS